jgi:hypothetical protein
MTPAERAKRCADESLIPCQVEMAVDALAQEAS